MKRSFAILMGTAALCVAGCNPTTMGIAVSPLFAASEPVNVLNSSFAAADQLSVQTIQKFPRDNTISVETLQEIVNPNRHRPDKTVITNPKVGMLISDQLEQRFIQLGYKVMPQGEASKGKVEGLYEVIGKNLAVRLRLRDTKTNVMLGQYDYWLPITPSIRRHMDEYSGGIPIYKIREGFDQIIDN